MPPRSLRKSSSTPEIRHSRESGNCAFDCAAINHDDSEVRLESLTYGVQGFRPRQTTVIVLESQSLKTSQRIAEVAPSDVSLDTFFYVISE